jgi:hydrogenase maturation factor
MLKCMITIGVEKDEVLARMNEQKHKSVDIIGLVVSQAHDSYVMLVKAAGSEQIEGAFFCVRPRCQESSKERSW